MDIFRNSTSSVPKSDPQIVRVDMEEIQIGGRKSHLPKTYKENRLSVTHVADSGATSEHN